MAAADTEGMITVERIDDTFQPLRWDSEKTVSRDFVDACMHADDIEVLGALYGFVAESHYVKRISPPLKSGELLGFVKRYFGRCLREDPHPDDFLAQRSLTRNGAGWDLVRWYVSLWKAESVDFHVLEDLKAWLGELYLDGDDELRRCLTRATLEPLLVSPTIRRFFSDWKAHPILAGAYAAATAPPARSRPHAPEQAAVL